MAYNTITIATKRLRVMIGLLGMSLAWLVCLITLSMPQSISITYYNIYAVGTFMLVLGSASILLICYKGYTKIDDIINTIAGILGLMICLFPMEYKVDGEFIKTGVLHLSSNISHIIHCCSAIGFFGLLAFNSVFLFTKSEGVKTKGKKIRNIIYYVCGAGMLLSFLCLLLPVYNSTWITEMLALTFFGISWLTKANLFKFLDE